ncbi:MAG: insulinase family protein [Parachlamydiaceae bacterium]|nr:insulinase family protein [Parachlamydiaceae bacterium]
MERLKSVGETYKDFKVSKIVEIPELQCVLRELVHTPTGAEVVHIANDDPENMFCLSFRTLPDNSNGVAHILEHTVLCGSEKYPVKDPFFAMTRRSLNTFMNAFTGSDFTCYPAASQVTQDFYNLLDVYIDAVFKPNLHELSFQQEGHRYEFSTPTDSTTPLTHKGIVFNEMKGALASGSARLSEAMNHALFPDLPYGFNSGGDPKEIPSLSYPALCAFHQKYYHPGHCLFFFYGNMPLEQHLDYIATHALEGIKKPAPLEKIPMQPRFSKPLRLTMDYPTPPEEEAADRALISFGWLTCHILKQKEVLALTILEIILMDTDASPLKQAFLTSGLCKQASVYMDDDISEVPFIITLKGCQPENAEALEKILRDTLQKIAQEGISSEAFEGAVHQLELSRSEIVGNHAPFGLSLFMRSALLKQHGGDSESGLRIHSLFDELRQQVLNDPSYLPQLLRKYLLDNPHFVCITMVPNAQLNAKEAQEETQELNSVRQKLAPGQIQQIIAKAAELEQFQKKQEEENPDILPKITLNDVPKLSRDFPLTKELQGPFQIFHHACFTNDIIYTDLVFNLPKIPKEDLSLVRLFTVLLAQMGCGGRNYVENLDYIQAYTGGVGAFLSFNIQTDDNNAFFPTLNIRGKALHRNANKLFPLLYDLITSVDFTDQARLKSVIQKHYTMLHSSLNQGAIRYAINLAASGLDVPAYVSNLWYGLDYYWTIKKIAEGLNTQLPALITRLQQCKDSLLGLDKPDLILSCDEASYKELKAERFYGLLNLKTKPYASWSSLNYAITPVPNQGRLIASPVAFTGHIFKTVPYTDIEAPALNVAACLFENITLHTRVREQGGAYGGGATCNTLAGNICFYAYRDPNISKTLKAFDEAIQTILDGEFEESDLDEAKLEVVQGLDAPVAPGNRAELAYERLREGKTFAVRQAFRERLLALTREDVIQAIRKYVVQQNKNGVTVIFAGKELLEKENQVLIAEKRQPFTIESI